MAPYALAMLLLASTPDAGHSNHCKIEGSKGDRVKKGGDVVVGAGETIEDAIAVDGDVRIKSGGTAKSAIALHGSVFVEDGATLNGSAVAIGGKVVAGKKAKIAESQVSLDKSLHIVSDDGDDVNLSASLGGKSLARLILKPMLEKLHDCDVSMDTDDK